MCAERIPRFNLEATKQRHNLVEFAQRYTKLICISRQGEYAGPCPRCGGEDRFHVKGARFYCRQCNPRGGDIIDFVQWLDGCTFVEACRQLQEDTFLPPDRPTPIAHHSIQVEKAASSSRPTDSDFQRSAWRTIKATQQRLLDEPHGEGQEYLSARGLTETTWRSYQLGFGQTYHPSRHQNMPAIFIPWLSQDGKKMFAIQHRFIDSTLGHNDRYTMKAGSAPTLFGLHRLQPGQQLVIVEGEFNCMAIQQCGFVALSIGSETNARKPGVLTELQTICAQYLEIAVWLDNPQRGRQLIADLTRPGDNAPRLIEQLLDANMLLIAGQLENFLHRTLNESA